MHLLIHHTQAENTDFIINITANVCILSYHTVRQSSLPLLAFSLIVISSSECFFLILCALSGQPDKLVQQVINDNF